MDFICILTLLLMMVCRLVWFVEGSLWRGDDEQEEQKVEGKGDVEMMPMSITAYTPINENSRIIHAAWHQGDKRIFTPEHAGSQCGAMVLANIVRAEIQTPGSWTSDILNVNMREGDEIYKTIRLRTNNNPAAYPIYENGYLGIRNFNVIKDNLVMFNKIFSINYADDADHWGCLVDEMNENNGVGKNLKQSLEDLFNDHKAGLLLHNSMSFGVMHYEGKYYFTDSHPCGNNGAIKPITGTACVIETDNIDELVRLCKRPLLVTSQSSVEYSLDFIDVIVIDGINDQDLIVSPELQEEQIPNCPSPFSGCPTQ